jgi:hypothetical protein
LNDVEKQQENIIKIVGRIADALEQNTKATGDLARVLLQFDARLQKKEGL